MTLEYVVINPSNNVVADSSDVVKTYCIECLWECPTEFIIIDFKNVLCIDCNNELLARACDGDR